MREIIEKFDKNIEDFYKYTTGKDVKFSFIHVNYFYKYIGKNRRVIDLNNGEIEKFIESRETGDDIAIVPVVMDKTFFEQNFKDDTYYLKRTYYINECIDLEISPNLNYNAIILKILETLPDEFRILTQNELEIIANEIGYKNLCYEALDHSAGKCPVAYHGPEWEEKFYGASKKVKEKKL